jgi:hypothetical protein
MLHERWARAHTSAHDMRCGVHAYLMQLKYSIASLHANFRPLSCELHMVIFQKQVLFHLISVKKKPSLNALY